MSIVYHFLSSTWLFLITFDFHADGGDIDIEKHLEMGRKHLGQGQFADALSHYHAAVEGDPNNYLTYFKRATVFLAMGKSKSAIPDLDQVIKLKPDFLAARIQRGNVFLKQGKLDEAHIDFEAVLQKDANNMDALSQLQIIEPLKRDFQIADNLMAHQDYSGALAHLERAVEVCPWDPIIREMRAECFIRLGDISKAINEIRPSTKLRSDNTDAYFRLSSLLYQIGRTDESLSEVRECLKLDPDHKSCYSHYKKIKKLVKQLESITDFRKQQKYEDCLSKANQALNTESSIAAIRNEVEKHICHCQMKAQNVKEAIDICSKVIQYEEAPDTICDRGDAYILDEQFDEAVEDFQRAINIDESLQRAREGLQRAQKLLKQSNKKDYYKILGVKRTAGKREILKAYRKLAQKWHPDNFRQEGGDKQKAEKMFIDIAAAKEVLSDPEKRQKFDNGEDPLDPEQQSHGGQQFYGFNPFGAGGFQFKFHFN